MVDKPFSQACENNKQPILDVLTRVFQSTQAVLEIGTGTGQHALHFAKNLSHLEWFSSDRPENHGGINLWLEDAQISNLHPPVEFTVGLDDWPMAKMDGVFTANTTHIMQPAEAKLMMQLVAEHLPLNGVFCQYGPFNVNGQFTSESNRAFNQHLLEQGYGGIRDIQEVTEWAAPLTLKETISMPANNFLLVWQKDRL